MRFGASDLLSLAIGIAAYAVLDVGFFQGTVRPVISPEARPGFALLSAINTMAWLFAILGFAQPLSDGGGRRSSPRRPKRSTRSTSSIRPSR